MQGRLVHTVGNLTLTGFNSNLGNKSFHEKRDRTDQSGRAIGYRNGFSLNTDVITTTAWGEEEIRVRGERLVAQVLKTFPLDYTS